MSTLSKEEKDALEDVFLSIQTNSSRFEKAKELSSLIIGDEISSIVSKLLRRAKFGLKKKKTWYFLSFSGKKKKSLSK